MKRKTVDNHIEPIRCYTVKLSQSNTNRISYTGRHIYAVLNSEVVSWHVSRVSPDYVVFDFQNSDIKIELSATLPNFLPFVRDLACKRED